MRRPAWILVLLAAFVFWAWQQERGSARQDAAMDVAAADAGGGDAIERPGRAARDAARWPAFLPPEARDTLALIESGGPFPYRQDGATFENREHRLPERARGYYREFTVDTPGASDRGARRIVAGGRPPVEYFYTDDHYGSFRRFTP